MTNKLTNIIKITTGLLILFFLILASSRYINLTTADLGRHIVNGKTIMYALAQHLDLINYTPLYKNFYSYTEAGFPVNNHHWLTGVLFALIHDSFGFVGLSVFNALCIIFANIFFFLSARILSNMNSALSALLLALSLTTWRVEVRPESISYFLMGLLMLILILYVKNKINFTVTAVAVSLIMLLWINCHIFFALGLFLIAVFYLNGVLISQRNFKRDPKTLRLVNNFLFIGLIATAVTLINPFGIQGLLQPLMIFKNFGYMLVENQSVLFMHKRFPDNLIYYYFDSVALITMLGFMINTKHRDFHYIFLLLAVVLGILGFKTNRMIPVFAFVAIPIIAYNFQKVFLKIENKPKINLIVNMVFLIWISILIGLSSHFKIPSLTLGLPGNTSRSAEFFKANNIQGPIFNNYDIGGFLIYNLFPLHGVFVDNRPEAYSVKFFKEIYEPMQKSEEQWQKFDKLYNFNAIYFMRQDSTEHAQPFLIRRISDFVWAPVFVDDTTIILLKRNELNINIIEKYELPQNIFKVVKT